MVEESMDVATTRVLCAMNVPAGKHTVEFAVDSAIASCDRGNSLYGVGTACSGCIAGHWLALDCWRKA